MYWALPLVVNGIPMDPNVNVEIAFPEGNFDQTRYEFTLPYNSTVK